MDTKALTELGKGIGKGGSAIIGTLFRYYILWEILTRGGEALGILPNEEMELAKFQSQQALQQQQAQRTAATAFRKEERRKELLDTVARLKAVERGQAAAGVQAEGASAQAALAPKRAGVDVVEATGGSNMLLTKLYGV